MSSTPEILFNYLSNIYYFKAQDPIDIEKIDKEYTDVAEGLMYLEKSLRECNSYAIELSRGNLDASIPHVSNEIAAALKSLHASLRHVTWQSQQVTKGDYRQRVDFMGAFADAFNLMVDQLAERQKKLEADAYHDELTGLYNRRFGMTMFNDWIQSKRVFSLIFIDLDNLKHVNDKFGHEEGDLYITNVSGYLKNYVKDEIICRLGGDEFMILKPNAGYDEAKVFMKELSYLISSDNYLIDKDYAYSLSYGIVEVKEDNTLPPSAILSEADEQMYKHKRERKKIRLSGK